MQRRVWAPSHRNRTWVQRLGYQTGDTDGKIKLVTMDMLSYKDNGNKYYITDPNSAPRYREKVVGELRLLEKLGRLSRWYSSDDIVEEATFQPTVTQMETHIRVRIIGSGIEWLPEAVKCQKTSVLEVRLCIVRIK